MTIETDIITALNSYAGLSALVASRNYAIHLPQKPAYPNTVFMRISSDPSNALTGRNSLTNARFQFDIRAKTYDKVREVANELINAIESTTLFKSVYLTDEDIAKETATETYRVSIDFSLWFYKT